MRTLLDYGNQYVRESDWKDLALIKLCLCSMGILIGIHVAPKHKKTVLTVSAAVFIASYIPLMSKLIRIVRRGEK